MIENLNMPENMKMRMSQLIKSLPKNNLEGSESYLKATKNTGIDSKNILKSEEDEIVEYKCSKCRDLRFILKDNEAIPCTCKALREAEEILANSGISEEIDLKLFKKAIEIATDKGKCNKGYIGGIIRQWLNNNIKTYDDLKAYELNQGGQLNDRKSKYAREYENEDESTYQKPTEEQLRRVRELLESN